MNRNEKWSIFAYVHHRVLKATLLSFLLVSGCATTWQTQGSFYRTTQAQLLVESKPSGKVYINHKYVGLSPVKVPLEYGREVERKTRKVSYWESQPGWSLFLTLASLGIYLPFSFIPVDIDTSLEPLDSFKDNIFVVEIDAEGYQKWKEEVICKEEKSIFLQPLLKKEDGKQN